MAHNLRPTGADLWYEAAEVCGSVTCGGWDAMRTRCSDCVMTTLLQCPQLDFEPGTRNG